jgi:hypothetical protein
MYTRTGVTSFISTEPSDVLSFTNRWLYFGSSKAQCVSLNVRMTCVLLRKVAKSLTECLPAMYPLPHPEHYRRRVVMANKRHSESNFPRKVQCWGSAAADMPQPPTLLLLLLLTSALAAPPHIVFIVADDMVSSRSTEASQCVTQGREGSETPVEISRFLVLCVRCKCIITTEVNFFIMFIQGFYKKVASFKGV